MLRLITTLFSLVALILLAAFWWRTLIYVDIVTAGGPMLSRTASTGPGTVGVTQITGPLSIRSSGIAKYSSHAYDVPIRVANGGTTTYLRHKFEWAKLGFYYRHSLHAPGPQGTMLPRTANALPGYETYAIRIPLWLPCLLAAIAPTRHVWVATRTHRRRRNNQCLRCGYDLRESPERCPECGAAAAGEFTHAR